MKHGRKTLAIIALGFLLLSPAGASDREFSLGYGLVFSLNRLAASEIDAALSDIGAGGHSSFFFIETPLYGPLSLSMSPGAMNFEDEASQFHVQYNLLSLNCRIGERLFAVAGAGIGGCIATLTQGDGEAGEAQNGLFVRNSAFLWTARIGIGYGFGNGWELTFDGRGFGFLDESYAALSSFQLGATIGMKL